MATPCMPLVSKCLVTSTVNACKANTVEPILVTEQVLVMAQVLVLVTEQALVNHLEQASK